MLRRFNLPALTSIDSWISTKRITSERPKSCTVFLWPYERHFTHVPHHIFVLSCAKNLSIILTKNSLSTSTLGIRRLTWDFALSKLDNFELQEFGYRMASSSVVEGNQVCWSNLPPELLRDIFARIERSGSHWPERKNVVACASVCSSWREIMKEIIKTTEESANITLPISLKQVGHHLADLKLTENLWPRLL